MSIRLVALPTVVLLNLTTCQERTTEPAVDYFLVKKSLAVHPNSALQIDTVANSYKVVPGCHCVLVFARQDSPVFKPGHKLTDTLTDKALLVEFDPANPQEPPLILRKLIALSRYHGIRKLPKNQVVRLTQTNKSKHTWVIDSHITGMSFRAQIDARASFNMQEAYRDY